MRQLCALRSSPSGTVMRVHQLIWTEHRGPGTQTRHGVVLRTALAALLARAQDPVHGAHRARVPTVLEQVVVDRRLRLVAVGLAVQRLEYLAARSWPKRGNAPAGSIGR
jgi:hypothetical protein